MSDLTRCLLDKVTARRMVEGLLGLAEGRGLSEEELLALDLYDRASAQGIRLFIVLPSENLLRRLASLPRYLAVVQLVLNRTEAALPARYFKRWARRLRNYFTREDAAVLALATFGTSKDTDVLGMHFVATFDQPLIHRWSLQQDEIEGRLDAMRRDLRPPYDRVTLPQVLRPEAILPSDEEENQ
jgi:hypothetical protein